MLSLIHNILISADAGANWLTVGAIGRWRDIEFKPNNSNVYMQQNNQAVVVKYLQNN